MIIRLLHCFVVILLLTSISFAQEVTTTITTGSEVPTQLESKIGEISIGYIRAGSREVANIAWHPDLKIGPWGFGADVNIPLGEDTPDGYENVVLRYMEYDDGKKNSKHLHGTSGPLEGGIEYLGGEDSEDRKFTHGCVRFLNQQITAIMHEGLAPDVTVEFYNIKF